MIKYLFAFLALATSSVFAANPPAQSNEVCFYEHKDYQGQRYCYSYPNEASVPWVGNNNDKWSSIEVGKNIVVAVYEHGYYGGNVLTFDGNAQYFPANFNDVTSSFRIFLRSPAALSNEVCFFEHPNYQGNRYCYSYPNEASVPMVGNNNDKWSSIKVGENIAVTAYEHNYYGGNVLRFDGNKENFPANFDNLISSFKIDLRSSQFVHGNQVCFYEHKAYQGQRDCYDYHSMSGMNVLGNTSNDKWSSVKLGNNITVSAFEHNYLGGTKLIINKDMDSFPDNFDNVISSFKINQR